MKAYSNSATNSKRPDRVSRAALLFGLGHVEQTAPGQWQVKSETSNRVYKVTETGCTCPDSRQTFICKHILAAHYDAELPSIGV